MTVFNSAWLGLRAQANLLNQIKLMLPVQSYPKKYSAFRHRPNHRYHFAHPPRQEGRIAIVTDAGLDAVDAAASGAIVIARRVLP
ncbi:hypothetical protein [Bradyrhizobium icense]|uniref:hypothetical protein n=1 Tax=Bradyrhizobium icense TaxID=1274631 RepID=UPI0012EA46B9|nr:hypothetical protein [Bradyrhizobium icense]